VNAARQYGKQAKMFPENSLSLDIDDFRSNWLIIFKITGRSLAGKFQ